MEEKYCGKISDLPAVSAGAHMMGGTKRIVFGPERFWDTHVMRCFTLQPGGMAANNHHPWVHWFVCLSGHGQFKIGDEVCELENGTWVFVPPEVDHGFWNTSETEDLVCLCTVTTEGDTDPLAAVRGC